MSGRKKTLNFSNSRIHFGNLIYEAAKQGDYEGLELILSQDGAKDHIDFKDKSGRTPLIVAAKNGELKCIKLLLSHGCDLHATTSNKQGKELHVWEIASQKGFRKTAVYLNGCLDDLTKYNYHRAMMEADVLEICQNKKITQSDLNEFDRHVNVLKTMTTFDIDGDEESESLLIVAAKADNRIIVKRLLEEYKVTPYSNDIKNGETALHIACKDLDSPLRFYITQQCPDLIFSVDTNGENPLHLACHMNDVSYVTWIFQRVLEKIEAEALPASLSTASFMSLQPWLLEKPSGGGFQSMSSHPNFHRLRSESPSSSSNSSLAHRQLPLFEEVDEHDEQSPVQHPLNIMLREADSNTGSNADSNADAGADSDMILDSSTGDDDDRPLTLIMKDKASRRSVKVVSSEGPFMEMVAIGGEKWRENTNSSNTQFMQSLTSSGQQVDPEDLEASTCLLSDNPLTQTSDRTITSTSEYTESTVGTLRQDITSGYESMTTVDSRRQEQALIEPAQSRKRNTSEGQPIPRRHTSPTQDYSSSSELSTLLDSTSELLKSTTLSHGPSPYTLATILPVHMRLFAVSAKGSSVLHITGRKGHSELLLIITQVAKHLESNPDPPDISILTKKQGTILTPLEEAIDKGQSKCLQLLLNFAGEVGVFDAIYNDWSSLLQQAVKVESLECLKVLCEYGLWKDTREALITILKKLPVDSIFGRYLMFYYTQVTLTTACSRVKRNGQVTVDSGVLQWNSLELEEVNPSWLSDAVLAISTVSFSLRSKTVYQPLQQNKDLFQRLGVACSEYFDKYMWQPQIHPNAWASLPITEINLSSNKLESIPIEVFQLSTLITLNLSKNQLVALPSNFDVQSPIYTCNSLKKLNLSQNCLTTLPEDLFYAIGNSLEELDARSNLIESLPPSLWICTKLASLNLSRNRLTQLHYFSDLKYFFDQTYSRNLINSIQIDQGVPFNSGKMSEEDFMGVLNYATRLNIFYHTVSHLLPTSLEGVTTPHYLQHVIDIHWLRTKLNSSQSTSSLEYFEVSVPPDESLGLTQLDLSYNAFEEFPRDLACIAPHLEKLDLRGNSIKNLDIVRDMPSEIASIILGNNRIASVHNRYNGHVCMNPVKLLDGYVLDPKGARFCRHKSHCILDRLTNLILQDNLIEFFNCIPPKEPIGGGGGGGGGKGGGKGGGGGGEGVMASLQSFDKDECQPYFPNLSVLSLERNNLLCVPRGIQYLVQLSSLSLSHNSLITHLPPEMGLMNPQVLLILKLDGISPKNIEPKLLNKPGARAILTYLKSLYHKSQPYYRIKLMLIGNSNVGKTSLLLNLTKKGKVSRFKEVEKGLNKLPLSTFGVDLGDWEYSPHQLRAKPITFMTWDFGGQIEYYATHQCFLTQRSLYIIVWNAQEKEKGLDNIRPWLDNIGSRIPKAPVIVVATHLDSLPSQRRNEAVKRLQIEFHKKFLSSSASHGACPEIYPKCFFVSCSEGTQISQLRDEIYEFALSIKPTGTGFRQVGEGESLLRQPVPECYVKLQDIVRSITKRFVQEKLPPILTTQEFRKLASEGNFPGKLDELEQATAFLHENGILLHYDDPSLSDLYFIDPQWLCSMLACVVTVQEKNPFQKNGFMEYSALQLVLRDERFPQSFLHDFVSLMQKFEVVLLLDKDRILIPSLLPADRKEACIVFPLSVSVNPDSLCCMDELMKQGCASITHLHMKVFARYYLLPFVPNGFFPRLIARIIGSKISTCFTEVVPLHHSHDNLYNSIHWRPWRNGIILIYHHMEVLRISTLSLSNLEAARVYISSSKGRRLLESCGGIEIMVATLPESVVTGESEYLRFDKDKSRSHALSVWILRQLTEITDSVFEDWYEGFARRKGFDYRTIQQASPCPDCLSRYFRLTASKHSPLKKTSTLSRPSPPPSTGARHTSPSRRYSTDYMDFLEQQSRSRDLHLFGSSFCVLMSSEFKHVECVEHGSIPVSEVAPDLAFADLPSSMLYHNAKITKMETLGSGGFGSVYKGLIEEIKLTVAIKEFSSIAGKLEEDPQLAEEMNAWDIYINGSREARMMHQLQHKNILSLVGLAFQPLRLILELAPLGDLKNSLKPFKQEKIKLNRRTLKQLIYQVADAMEYIHSKHIIYRDLKPGNILVWRFPEPKTQWNDDASVHIKLADYGISKHCTAEGARGSEGTPAFLPPEVILHGGAAAFTTKLDIYSFAMFMYYLFTYQGPFENEKGRPISALLDEGKRPELSLSHRPVAIQMYELMCWCWSNNPQHRPDFTQIKSIISSTACSQLLDAKRLTLEDNRITVAAMHTFRQPFSRRRQQKDEPISEKPSIASPSASVLSVLAASSDEDELLTVFYGTSIGKVGMVRFLPGEKINYEIMDQLQCHVTCIVSVGGAVWIGTWGKGISVYDVMSKTKIGTWGEEEGATVYNLLYVKESSLMVALTSTSVAVLETGFPAELKVARLEVKYSYAFAPTLTTGVVITPHGKLEETEVWCCPLNGGSFKILTHFDSRMFSFSEVMIPASDVISTPKINNVHAYEVGEESKLLVSDGRFLQFWDIVKREKERGDVDCHTYCKRIHKETDLSVVMSLLVSNGKIFIGTCSGIIIVLNSVTHDVIHLYHGYKNEVSSILSMSTTSGGSHIKRFSRILSKKDSIKFDSSSLFPELTTSGGDYSSADRNLILTLGRGYRGAVGNHSNHPPTFLFPSSSSCSPSLSSSSLCSCSSSCSCSCDVDSLRSKVPRPNPNDGFLLFWSCEDQPTFNPDAGGSNSCSTVIELSTEITTSSSSTAD